MSNAIFNGVPWDHTASVSFDADPNITYFFRMDPATNLNKVYIHDEVSNTTTVSDIGIPTMFPSVSTIYPIRMGGENLGGPNPDEHLICWIDTTIPNPNRLTTVVTSPTAVVVQQFAQSDNLVYHEGQSIEQASTGNKWYAHFSFDRWLALRGSTQHFLSTGSYGGVGQPYAGLPYIGGGVGVETNYCSLLRVNGQENQMYLFTPTGDAIIMDLLAQQISSTVPYGPIGAAPPVVPPTPLPDIEVVYQAPAEFNLFASDVSLVTETPLGWNFTKTILTADKMELYNYFATAPGAIPFNYNDLRDLRATMQNNLALGSGNIFFNVYTVGTAGGWYGSKTTYFGTPALGTTIDTELVETIIPISDARTDQILAISIGSNSAQQQVNVDVHQISFEILKPTTNETQRVIVRLQNNFIVVDDKYWDLESNPIARLGTQILPTFEMFSITPNIIAGNYPQSGTAKEPPAGCAYYLNGTWSEWTQTSANVWAPSGNTLTFTSGTVNPGIDTNGAAYVGTIGGFSFSPNWPSSPFTWNITTSNQVKITLNNGQPILFSPLADLPQPQNTFTAAQFESGLFSSSDVGTLTTSVLISNSVSSFKSPVFPREIDLTFLSESQVIIRRSWEIADTTYTITSSNVLSGQYVSPTYPVSSTPLVPDTYTMPTEWVVLANNDSQFFIEFSGGLNNTITADGAYNMAVNPVGPSPITYAWTANYYSSADVLISPVVGAGATGSVSNFNITLASVPASAEYILYVCTSSENVQAFASLVIIQAAAAIPFVLDFQNQSAQIVVDATYTVTPNPVDAGAAYTYTATYNNEFDASLGNVLGAVASGPQSSFNFVYANIPTGTKYINYSCSASGGSQGGETARLSISIIPQIPPAPQTFELEFNGGVAPVNITADGTYDVVPYPTESALIITYTYTANYYSGTTDLGPVVGFTTTGQSSTFTFTFAGMPAGATYIKYVCSAAGTGLQNGETAESIIGLVSPNPGNEDVDLVRQTTGSIMFSQYNTEDCLKEIMGDRITGLTMTLTDSYGDTLHSDTPIYYELNVRSSNSGGGR